MSKIRGRVAAALTAAALITAPVLAAPAAPAQAVTCAVHVVHGPHAVQGKRTAGTCRFEVLGTFNLPGQNGVRYVGNDATTGYSTIYVPGGIYACCARWRLS